MEHFTGEFGASFVAPSSLATTHAATLAGLVVVGAVGLKNRALLARMLRDAFSSPASPIDLAVFRIAVCLGVAAKLSVGQALFYSEWPRSLLFPPFGTMTLASAIPLGRTAVLTAVPCLCVCLAAGVLGIGTRMAMLGVGVLGAYVLGIPQLFGKVNHYNHLVWFAGLLAACDSGAALSLDAVRRRRGRAGGAPPPSAAFGFPLAVARVVIGLLYFFPGWWKLWLSGTDWFRGDGLRSTMLNLQFVGMAAPPPWLAESKVLLAVGCAGVVLFELSFLFLVLVPRLRPLAVLAGLAFHVLAGVVLNIWFVALVLCYVVFVDWGVLLRRLGERSEAAPAATRPATLTVVVGGLLIAATVLAGAGRVVHGWPFACYPIFAPAPEPRMYVLGIVRVDESGEESPVDVGPFARRAGLERWVRLAQRLAATEPPGRQDALARALLAVWRRSEAAMAGGDRYRLYLETHGTEPGSRVGDPVVRRMLADTGDSVAG